MAGLLFQEMKIVLCASCSIQHLHYLMLTVNKNRYYGTIFGTGTSLFGWCKNKLKFLRIPKESHAAFLKNEAVLMLVPNQE